MLIITDACACCKKNNTTIADIRIVILSGVYKDSGEIKYGAKVLCCECYGKYKFEIIRLEAK